MTPRFRAPVGDGELLAVPDLAESAERFARNGKILNTSEIQFGSTSLSQLRRLAVEEVLAAARVYLRSEDLPTSVSPNRLLVAGHQPEFFHPGVWVKNFVLNGLAEAHGYTPLNLVVDNDTIKASALRVPVHSDRAEETKTEDIPFDEAHTGIPYEEHPPVSRTHLDTFLHRLNDRTRDWTFKPIVFDIWPNLRADIESGKKFWDAASRLRRKSEHTWGVRNLELPVSLLANTRSFATFVTAIVNDLPRFSDAYNSAIHSYRQHHRLRSRNHPAPNLERTGDWLEAPFWMWTGGAGTRERMFVRPVVGGLEFQAGHRNLGRQTWDSLKSSGWKIRPRALTLTMFVRLCLADGFIHGIGGGKYDEVTDAIIERYFQLRPPAYSVVSATLRLPIPRFPATPSDEISWHRRVRDLQWNPQNDPVVQTERPELVERKRELIASEPPGHADRRRWFRELQETTRDMRCLLEPSIEQGHLREHNLQTELAANKTLASREYSWLLFPAAMLEKEFGRMRNFASQGNSQSER